MLPPEEQLQYGPCSLLPTVLKVHLQSFCSCTVDSKQLEYGFRVVDLFFCSVFGLGSEDGHQLLGFYGSVSIGRGFECRLMGGRHQDLSWHHAYTNPSMRTLDGSQNNGNLP